MPQLHQPSQQPNAAADGATLMAVRRILAEQSADAVQSAAAAQSANYLPYYGSWPIYGLPLGYGGYTPYLPATAGGSFYNAVAAQPRYW